jgi:hypothetical protein
MTSRGLNYWESTDGRDQRLIFAMNGMLQELDARKSNSVQWPAEFCHASL